MEDYNKIDDLFRSAIEPLEESPSDKVWAALDGELAKNQAAIKKKKDNRRLLLGLAALLVTSVTTIVLNVNWSDKANRNTISELSSSTASRETNRQSINVANQQGTQSTNSIALNEQGATNSPSLKSNTITAKKQNVSHPFLADNSGKSIASTAGKNSSFSNNYRSKPSQTNHGVDNNNVNSVSGYVNTKESSSNSASGQNTHQTGSQSVIPPVVNTSAKNNETGRNDFREKETESNNPSSDNNSANENPVTNNHSPALNKTTEDLHQPTAQAEPLKQEEASTEAQAEPLPQPSPPSPPLPPIGNFFTKLSVAAFYSPEVANRYLKTTDPNTNSITTNSEKFNFSYNTGINIRYDLTDRWSMALGASYSTLSQQTTVSTNYIVPPETTQNSPYHQNGHDQFPGSGFDSTFTQHFADPTFVQRYFTYSSGTQQYIYNTSCGAVQLENVPYLAVPINTSNKADTIRFTTNTTIRLEYINVPLTARYQFSRSRFTFYATAGVSFNFLLNKEAKVGIGNAYSETSHNIDGLRKMYYGYLAGAGVEYRFYKGMSFYLQPNFRGAINSITNDNSSSFYPYSLGINIGLSYHF